MNYSQNNEQEIILNYFDKFIERHGHPGALLSIGENDGYHLSNVLAMIERGWKGILVEPSPIAFLKLQELHRSRSGIFCYQVAIADGTGPMPFFDSDSHLKDGDTSLLSTLKKTETKRWSGVQTFDEIMVDAQTFKDFMEDKPIQTFDLISIDAEGMDLTILKQIDLVKTKTSMVIVEWNGNDFTEFDDYFKFNFFKLHHKNAENLIYISTRSRYNYE